MNARFRDSGDTFAETVATRLRDSRTNPYSGGATLAPGATETSVGSEPRFSPPTVADRWSGRNLGSYQILNEIDAGAMGAIYRARDLRTGSMTAIKTVHSPRESLLPRIRREIQALARIQHPGIVRILDSGMADGIPWYAMELVEGVTLREHVPPPGQASTEAELEQRLTLVRRLCSALSYLHGEGLIHRDIKPSNVLVKPTDRGDRGMTAPVTPGGTEAEGHGAESWGQPILADFGLVSAIPSGAGREALDTEGGAVGTPLYMAPEQIEGGVLDARADLYALGCILHELLTGSPPFRARTRWELLQAHLKEPPRPPSAIVPHIPEALDSLVLRLLAKRPRDRIGYADDVAAELAVLAPDVRPRSEPRSRAYLYRPGFAGRGEALELLKKHLSRLMRGRGSCLLLGGESGIGKTRLAMEAARLAESAKIRVLSGECLPAAVERASAFGEPPEGVINGRPGTGLPSTPGPEGDARIEVTSHQPTGAAIPLHPLRKLLQAIADRCGERGWVETERVLGRRGRVLALYEPTLAALPGQDAYPEPAELPADAALQRLYSDLTVTLTAFVEEVSGPEVRPAATLLVLDDLQWADELTLGFLRHWLRTEHSGARRPVALLILGTYRTEEVGPGLRDLISTAGVESLELERLGADAVGSIVGDMLALAPPPALFVQFLSARSGGNPFFVAEVLRAALAEGLLFRDDRGRWQVAQRSEKQATLALYEALPLPGSVQELIARRLDGLSAPARKLAEAAAVLGREADESVLAACAAQYGVPNLDALEELRSRQVLEEHDDSKIRFVHDRIWEITYERIEAAARRALHAAAAEALETSLTEDGLQEHRAALGRHWELAGDSQRACHHYLAGARADRERYAHAQSERLYRSFLALGLESDLCTIEARNELGMELGFQGRPREGIAEHEAALSLARALGDPGAMTESLLALGDLLLSIGQTNDARARFTEALELAELAGNRRNQGTSSQRLASLEFQEGRVDPARELVERALDLSRAVGDRRGEGASLNRLSSLHMHRGRFEDAHHLLKQALEIHRELRDRRSEGVNLANLGVLAGHQGAMDSALRYFQEALAVFREIGHRRFEAHALNNLGSALAEEQGRPQEGIALMEQATQILREIGDRQWEAVNLASLAALRRRLGQFDESEPMSKRAEVLAREVGDSLRVLSCMCERGHMALARGRTAEARVVLDRAVGETTRIGTDPASPLGRDLTALRGAVEAAQSGQALFRGERVEDLSEGLRRWLVESGQLGLDWFTKRDLPAKG